MGFKQGKAGDTVWSETRKRTQVFAWLFWAINSKSGTVAAWILWGWKLIKGGLRHGFYPMNLRVLRVRNQCLVATVSRCWKLKNITEKSNMVYLRITPTNWIASHKLNSI